MPTGRVWNESAIKSYSNLQNLLYQSDDIEQV